MFRWLVTGLSLQSLGTDPCPVCLGDLWWTKWHWGRFSLQILQFLLSQSIQAMLYNHFPSDIDSRLSVGGIIK
jgi:hypothetical protein